MTTATSHIDPLAILDPNTARRPRSGQDWPDVVPFDEGRDVPPFPVPTLPPPLRSFAESLAAHFLAPVDLPAVMALGCTSAAIAGRVRVRVGPNWFEPGNTYSVSVLPPSLHKSPVMKLATAPIEEEERDLVARWRAEEAERETKREVVKHRIASIKRRKATAETEQALREAMAELAALAPLPRPALLSDDATSEALPPRLQHGPLFMCSAEGRPFELMSGLYRSKGEDGADVYLKAWSEDPIRAARVGSGDVYVPHPNLTLCLAVQPAVVDKLARRDDFRGRGLIARFLCSFPRTRVGFRDWTTARPISDVATQNYNHTIRSLLSLPRADRTTCPPFVAMSAEARPIFAAYRQELEHAQRREALLAEWQDLGGKLAGHCARIALVLHMAEHGRTGVERELSAETMTAAVTLTRYFVAHTIATWDGCAAEQPAARVVRWLARERRTVVTTREIHRAHQRLYPRAQDARAACIELAERAYLRATDGDDRWEVTPRLQSGRPDRDDSGDNGAGRLTTLGNRSARRVTAPLVTADDTGDRPALSSLSPGVTGEALTLGTTENTGLRARNGPPSPLSPGVGSYDDKGAR